MGWRQGGKASMAREGGKGGKGACKRTSCGGGGWGQWSLEIAAMLHNLYGRCRLRRGAKRGAKRGGRRSGTGAQSILYSAVNVLTAPPSAGCRLCPSWRAPPPPWFRPPCRAACPRGCRASSRQCSCLKRRCKSCRVFSRGAASEGQTTMKT